jgi:hypothetical protein
VDPKLFVTDPDPTFQRVMVGSGSKFSKVPDPVSDPTLNAYFFSRTLILEKIFKHTF